MSKRLVAILFGIIVILSGTVLVITFARGYQFNPEKNTLEATGILVATSDPVGASVYIDGKLKTATNTTVNLPPGKYNVRISLDGYTDWNKTVEIKKEEVFKTNAFLFPKAADLRPLTLNGAKNPTLSPSGTKIAYTVASASAQANGVWVLDMAARPIIGGADFRQLFRDNDLTLSNTKNLIWSMDETQLIASTSAKISYSLNNGQMNVNPDLITAKLEVLKTQWQKEASDRSKAQLSTLPIKLPTANFKFSPDETKVLYVASTSASLPVYLTTYLPGRNPTSEVRNLTSGNTYVYDVKEDKNYEISNLKSQISNLSWYPTSRHLVWHTDKEIFVTEYDGTNKAVIYNGPFINGYVYPWPGASKIVILTSLNQSTTGENLYSINLR